MKRFALLWLLALALFAPSISEAIVVKTGCAMLRTEEGDVYKGPACALKFTSSDFDLGWAAGRLTISLDPSVTQVGAIDEEDLPGSTVFSYANSTTNTVTGSKTADFYGWKFANTSTSSTASINKYGISLECTGTWNGSSAQNRCMYLNATGGTTNYALYVTAGNIYSADIIEFPNEIASKLQLAGAANPTYAIGQGFGYVWYGSGGWMQWLLGSTARMSLTNDGQLHLGSEANSTSGVARLHITEETIGNEVFRAESTATSDDPNYKMFQSRATAAASATTNIDLSLTGGEIPCPASSVCIVEARALCHCTSGSSCTAHNGAANISTMTVKNNGGTISLIGSVVTDMSTQIDSSSITSMTLSVSSPSARMAVVVPANFNHTCHVTWIVQNVGA